MAAYVDMFDYVLLEGAGDPATETALPQHRLHEVNVVGDFRLYAVRRNGMTHEIVAGADD